MDIAPKGARTLSEMYRKTRDEAFGAEVKARIMLGYIRDSLGLPMTLI